MEDTPEIDVTSAWRAIRIFGWVVLPGTVALSLRLIYEQTWLTYQEGPQMVGFALTHAYPITFVLMLLSRLLSYVCLLAAAIAAIVHFVQRGTLPKHGWVEFLVLLVFTAALHVPYGGWRYMVIRLAGPGEHAAEHLSHSAASGEARVVRELLRRGVPVDVRDHGGATALNAACVGRQVEIAQYLLAQGADPDRARSCEWLPEVTGKPRRTRIEGQVIEVKP